jgi:hypothetical protein
VGRPQLSQLPLEAFDAVLVAAIERLDLSQRGFEVGDARWVGEKV